MEASKAPTQVPVIDIEPFRSGGPSDKANVASEIAEVCESLGFLIVSGHGVREELIGDAYAALKGFFDLPLDEKEAVQADGGGPGYRPMESTALARSLDADTPPDLNERYTIAPIDVSDDAYHQAPEAREWFLPNRWPDQPADFKAACSSYYRAMEELAATLMRAFATALELDETYFDDKIDKQIGRLSGIHYPPQEADAAPGQLRAGAHTDYGCLTILYKDRGAGGLQVLHPSGDWIDVDPVPGTFIVNIGDLLSEWTNDRWVSTFHRVVNPPRDVAATNRRISVPFFHQPNYDAVISPLETCVSDARPAKYDPVTSGEHFHIKLGKTVQRTSSPS